jgi:hypothetical protein
MSLQFPFGPTSGGEPLPVVSIILADANGQTTPPLLAVVDTGIGYALALRMGSLELPEVEIYSSRKMSEVILGRNVLNQFVFTYNGPRRILDILIS